MAALLVLTLAIVVTWRRWHRPRLNLDEQELKGKPQLPDFVKKRADLSRE